MTNHHFLALPSFRTVKAGLTVGTCLLISNVMAQYGASPSQTSLFFDDLRARSQQTGVDNNSGVRDGDVSYDYDRGVYVGSDEREMGEPNSVYQSNEAARQMGQPAARAGSNAFAARGAGDYTNYSGQYGAPSSFFAPTYVSDPFLGGRRNVRVGPVNVGFGLFGSVEYNDNVTRAPSGQEVSDVVASTLLNIDANYQVTQNNRLTVSTAVGFDHYFNNPDLAPYGSEGFVLNVLPGSTIAFDIKAGPVFITIYDRLSVRPGVRNDFALSANQIFGVFQNDAGIAAMWQINSQLSLSMNYLHSNAIALEDQFNIFDRDMDSIQGNLTWSPSGTWALGLEGGMSWVRYPEQFNNDGRLANIGAVFSTPIGKSTFLRAVAGYQNFDFDAPPEFNRSVTDNDIQETQDTITAVQRTLASGRITSEAEARQLTELQAELQGLLARQFLVRQQEDAQFNANNRDNSDLGDYYYNVTLTNQLSARVTQVLSFGHESALNNVSNFITADYLSYGVSIIAWRGSRISLSGYYEDAEMSGGLAAEDLTQHGFDAYWNHQLSSTVRFGVGYHYGSTDSDLALRDFEQHAISADVSFALSPKATLSFGYRYFTTDAETEQFSFDQNRFVMALNYNF